VKNTILESVDLSGEVREGMICSESGQCFFMDDLDRLVDQRIVNLKNKFRI
jgi:hypothetical protein